jgi:ethanolamine ammonia-lyase small subunit
VIDRSRIEQLVRSALGELPPRGPLDSSAALLLPPERGPAVAAPYDPPALRGLLAATPARIAVGRAGTRYRTGTLLRFRADHAAAKDAVLSEVDEKLVAKLGLLELQTRAATKAQFLQRPDAGRALSDESAALVDERVAKGAQLVVVYGDGLSAAALNQHLEALHGALERELAARGVKPARPALFVRRSRVKVMDEIARRARCEACLFVCGERPGLGFSDSLSAYYMYTPPSGTPTDADREVISNINPRGLDPVRAAASVAEAIARVIKARKSGVVLG